MSTLHEEFRGAINDGDERLREHVNQEARRLEVAVEGLKDQIGATREALGQVSLAQIQRLDEKIDALDGQIDRRLHAARDYNDGIFVEHQRHREVAEQEREKSAKALRDELTRAIQDGDKALRDHIIQQVQQIQSALVSAEKLEVQRIGELKAMIEGAQRETDIAFAASEKAIEKAESANEKRFEAVNEFRAQLSDQATQFIPREVFETTLAAVNDRVRSLELSGSQAGGEQGVERRQAQKAQSWQIWAAGAILTVVITLVVITVNLATTL